MAENVTARRFRRKVSDEMQVRLPAQTPHTKMRDGGGIGGQVFADARLWRSFAYGIHFLFEFFKQRCCIIWIEIFETFDV
jgi:hypothetical protein